MAFPQHGVIRTPGTAELLEEAARTGAIDPIGGIDPIGFDQALDEQLDLVFDIADRHGIGVDIHLHDRGEKGIKAMRGIIDRTRALSLTGKVTVSHVFCLPGLTDHELSSIAADLGDQDIALTTVAPSDSLVLPIARLREHGVRVGLGSDGVRDSWSPFGNADMLHRAHLLGWVTDVRLDDELTNCYRVAAHGGADVMGLAHTDFEPGAPADFVLVRGECPPQVRPGSAMPAGRPSTTGPAECCWPAVVRRPGGLIACEGTAVAGGGCSRCCRVVTGWTARRSRT